MKTLKKYAIRLAVLVALIAGGSMTAKSQVSLDAYYNVDWQFNMPINKFADKASGWLVLSSPILNIYSHQQPKR